MRSTTRTTAAIAGLFAASAAAQNSTSTCASGVHLIVARGSNEPAGVGRIGSVANGVVAAIPGSQIEPLDYPATFDNYSISVEDGDIAMNLALTAYSSRCPDSKVALLGYSQYASKIASWCDTGDVYCDIGNNTKVHGSYFANYTDDAVEFVVAQFNASKTNSTSPSATPTPSTVPASGAGATGPGTLMSMAGLTMLASFLM
ncbi:hypothetical protein CBS470a_001657 [Colletotrichum nupharicola]|nr:hypothetical protein CBS470a_001657 [Colletotrichum nupharicola]